MHQQRALKQAGAFLIRSLDRIFGLNRLGLAPLDLLRARAICLLSPLAGLFAFGLCAVQFHSERAGGAIFGGLLGVASWLVPFGLGVILMVIPVGIRVIGAIRLHAILFIGSITAGLIPWPLILYGVYSRNIPMLTGVPVLLTLLISRRAGFIGLLALGVYVLALPILGAEGVIHQIPGVSLTDGFGQAVAVILTAAGLTLTIISVTALYNEAVKAAVEARLDALGLAERDQLTGLCNRRVFTRTLEERIDEANEGGAPVCLTLVDLDHFKAVNDNHGHSAGDQLLVTIARRLRRLAEDYPGCTPARLGGDEFALILSAPETPGGLEAFANRLVAAMRAPVETDHAVIYPTISVGVACCPSDAVGLEDLQWMADVALYASKSAGRDQWHKADDDMRRAVQERESLVAAMRGPDFLSQLEVWYQPQSSLRTGNIRGLEALIRWRHPQFGLLMPDSFIRHMEENGLIGMLTEHVIHKAVEQAAPWLKSGMIDRLAINISGHDLKDLTLVSTVERVIEAHAIAPDMLELEVTESFFLWNLEATFTVLQALGSRGVRVALDDFGTGYSSLSYLRTLPINTIKIDKSFVFDCDTNPNSLAIVQAIIGLARTLSMETVAEGVETDAQHEVLARLGSTRMQGFQLSRPMTASDCALFLDRRVKLARRA